MIVQIFFTFHAALHHEQEVFNRKICKYISIIFLKLFSYIKQDTYFRKKKNNIFT